MTRRKGGETTRRKGGEMMRKSSRRRRGKTTTTTTMSGEITRHPNTPTALLGGNANHDDQWKDWKETP